MVKLKIQSAGCQNDSDFTQYQLQYCSLHKKISQFVNQLCLKCVAKMKTTCEILGFYKLVNKTLFR